MAATVAVVGAALVVWGLSGVHAPLPIVEDPITTPTPDTSTGQAVSTTIKLALLDTAEITGGKERGCDRIVMQEQVVPATTTPLTAALAALFAEEREQINGAFNFMTRTNDTLHFDRATVESGIAKIYLSGSLSGLAGVCDDPRAQIQIEETALQFPIVQKVEIYLNGTKTILTPSER